MTEGDRIKDGRLALKLTQLELADKLGVSIKTVNNWENNRFQPTSRIRGMINKIFEYHLGKRNAKVHKIKISSAKKGDKFNVNDIFN